MKAFPGSKARLLIVSLIASVALGGAALVYSQNGSDGAAGAKTPPLTTDQKEAVSHANTLSHAFRTSAEKVLPSVVSIQHTSKPKMVKRDVSPRLKSPRGNLPKEFEELDPLLKRFFGEMPDLEEFRDLPGIPQTSSGSGVIIDPSGVILTNNHVVGGGGKIVVKLHDGREFEATDVKTDPNTDIAVIRIKASDLPAAKLGNSDQLQVGDWVLALGQPFGLQDTVTAGIISAKQRSVSITKHAEFLQTDAAINPGNSGGPLVNLEGEVVGVNTAISSNSGGFQGVGFAVPVNVAKWVSSQLLKHGKVRRAYIGVGIQPVTRDLAEQLGMKLPSGAVVTDVFPGSPAAEAGIEPRDVIVEFGKTPILSSGQLHAMAGRAEIGSKQPVVVMRDGKKLNLTITLREQPANFGVQAESEGKEASEAAPPKSFDTLGLEVGPLTPELAKQLGIRDNNGVVITGVEEGSLAEKAGLEASMVIAQVGRKPVKNVEEFQAAMKDTSLEKGVMFLVRSSEGSRFVVLRSE